MQFVANMGSKLMNVMFGIEMTIVRSRLFRPVGAGARFYAVPRAALEDSLCFLAPPPTSPIPFRRLAGLACLRPSACEIQAEGLSTSKPRAERACERRPGCCQQSAAALKGRHHHSSRKFRPVGAGPIVVTVTQGGARRLALPWAGLSAGLRPTHRFALGWLVVCRAFGLRTALSRLLK